MKALNHLKENLKIIHRGEFMSCLLTYKNNRKNFKRSLFQVPSVTGVCATQAEAQLLHERVPVAVLLPLRSGFFP